MQGLGSRTNRREMRLRRGGHSSAYAIQRRLGFPLLRFIGELESEYQHTQFLRAKPRIRTLSLVSVTALLLFDFVDQVIGASLMIAPAAWLLTALGVPLALIALLASMQARQTRWLHPIAMSAFVGFGLVISITILWSRTVHPAMPYQTLLLLTFAGYLLSAMSIYQSLATGLALMACHLGGSWLLGIQSPALIYEMYYLGVVNILGFIGLYVLEHQARMSFLVSNELRLVSMHDGLTGLFNRRSFRRHLHKAWNQARREGKSIGLIRLDVDYFKRLNDDHGHALGDLVLRTVAQSLSGLSQQPLDAFARVGGDEFEGFWYDPEGSWFNALDKHLREKLRYELTQAGLDSELVSLSGGSALITSDQLCTMEEQLQRIDALLYQAKRDGRNRIMSKV